MPSSYKRLWRNFALAALIGCFWIVASAQAANGQASQKSADKQIIIDFLSEKAGHQSLNRNPGKYTIYDEKGKKVGILVCQPGGKSQEESYSPDGSRKVLETDAKGWSKHSEYDNNGTLVWQKEVHADGSIAFLDNRNNGATSTYTLDKSGEVLEQTFSQSGTKVYRKVWRQDNGLTVERYQDDGKSLRFRQSWRYEPNRKGTNRLTPYLLESLQEYDKNGALIREITFFEDGKTVQRITHVLGAGKGTERLTFDRNGNCVRNSSISATGAEVDNQPGTVKAGDEPAYDYLGLDPATGGNEPGVYRSNLFND